MKQSIEISITEEGKVNAIKGGCIGQKGFQAQIKELKGMFKNEQ